jgi:hypothetical protein
MQTIVPSAYTNVQQSFFFAMSDIIAETLTHKPSNSDLKNLKKITFGSLNANHFDIFCELFKVFLILQF